MDSMQESKMKIRIERLEKENKSLWDELCKRNDLIYTFAEAYGSQCLACRELFMEG